MELGPPASDSSTESQNFMPPPPPLILNTNFTIGRVLKFKTFHLPETVQVLIRRVIFLQKQKIQKVGYRKKIFFSVVSFLKYLIAAISTFSENANLFRRRIPLS